MTNKIAVKMTDAVAAAMKRWLLERVLARKIIVNLPKKPRRCLQVVELR
jgi:hypothetical protein